MDRRSFVRSGAAGLLLPSICRAEWLMPITVIPKSPFDEFIDKFCRVTDLHVFQWQRDYVAKMASLGMTITDRKSALRMA